MLSGGGGENGGLSLMRQEVKWGEWALMVKG